MKQLSNKKQQSGFTLIELVVVIVILGILSATALPKLQGMDADARVAVVEGAIAAFKSGAAISYSKAKAAVSFSTVTAALVADNITWGGTCGAGTATYTGSSTSAAFSVDSSICTP